MEDMDVIVGVVTNGSAKSMLIMVFSLMPLFDISVSWEDDLESVQSQTRFQELCDVEQSHGLSWIYRLAVEKGRAMTDLAGEIQKNGNGDGGDGEGEDFEWAWVHVGDDLADDVGGSATTGTKMVLVDLAPEYGQTARLRREGQRLAWTTRQRRICRSTGPCPLMRWTRRTRQSKSLTWASCQRRLTSC